MINKFLEYLTIEKRYSPHTIRSYRKDLTSFLQFYQKTESSNQLEDASKKSIRNFIIELSKEGYSKRTINRKLSSLRSFYLFLLRTNVIQNSPMETIQSLKFNSEKPIPLSKEEMKTLREIFKKEETPIIDKLILEILYQTGIRKAELCNLKYEDFSPTDGQLKIHGKGNKQRIVPISPQLKETILSYIKNQKKSYTAKCQLLRNHKEKNITEKFVYSTTNKYLSLITTKKKKSPHILRHSFATHILENGAEISNVKELLGHASLSSTQVYTDANIEQLKKVFNNAHPRAKNKNKPK